jgi:hypothetical protein
MKTTHNGFQPIFLLTAFLLSACGGGSGGGCGGGSTPNQSVCFGTAPTIVVGGTGTVSATATSSLAVSLTSITSSVCTVSGNTVTGISTGTCTIAANQAGNSTYNAATQVTQSFIVTAILSGQVRNVPSGSAFVLSNTGGESITIPTGSMSHRKSTPLVATYF